MLDAIRDLLFPAHCAGCDVPGNGLCRDCVPDSEPLLRALPTLRVRALGPYDGTLRRAVLTLKDGRRDVACALSDHLAQLVARNELLVPVPTSAVRRRMRGFDGGVLLARLTAHAAGAHVLEALTLATRDAQRGRDRRDRLAARGRFRCRTHALAGARVVLLDDVVTTGTTLEDCAAALRASGAVVNEAVAVASASPDGH